MRQLTIIVLLVLLNIKTTKANFHYVTLTKALEENIVSLEARSTNGGYSGKGIQLVLKNNTHNYLDVYIDPAMTFACTDDRYQDLVLLGNEIMVLDAHSDTALTLQTFCGKSYAWGPREGLSYTYLKQGDSNMIKMLTYAKIRDIDRHLIQRAVWMFTNGHKLRNVYSYTYPDVSRNFVHYISYITHQEIPEFYVRCRIVEHAVNRSVFVAGTDTTFVDVHWKESPRRNAHVSIYDSNGNFIKEVTDNEYISSEGHTVVVAFPPKAYPDGVYYVKMHDDENRVHVTKKVVIG